MKNFKVILSFAALIVVGNVHALTLSQKREFNGVIAAVEAKKTLTQAQKDIITKYINMKRDNDIEAGINKLTKAGLDLADFRNEEGIQQPTQEAAQAQEAAQETTAKPQTVSTGKPLTLAERRQARGGKQPEPVQKAVTPTPQAVQETVRPQTVSTGKPLTLAERRLAAQGKTVAAPTVTPTTAQPSIFEKGAWEKASEGGALIPTIIGEEIWEASAEGTELKPKDAYLQVAHTFYDQETEKLNENGIKKYVDNIKRLYPDLKGKELINQAYNDATKILDNAINIKNVSKAFNRYTLFNNLRDMITSAAAPALPARPVTSQLSKSQEALELLKKDVSLAPNTKDQIKLLKSGTVMHSDAFFYNNELRPDWFAFAKEIVEKNYTDKSEVNEIVTQLAREILQLLLQTKELPEKLEKAINTEVEWVMS